MTTPNRDYQDAHYSTNRMSLQEAAERAQQEIAAERERLLKETMTNGEADERRRRVDEYNWRVREDRIRKGARQLREDGDRLILESLGTLTPNFPEEIRKGLAQILLLQQEILKRMTREVIKAATNATNAAVERYTEDYAKGNIPATGSFLEFWENRLPRRVCVGNRITLPGSSVRAVITKVEDAGNGMTRVHWEQTEREPATGSWLRRSESCAGLHVGDLFRVDGRRDNPVIITGLVKESDSNWTQIHWEQTEREPASGSLMGANEQVSSFFRESASGSFLEPKASAFAKDWVVGTVFTRLDPEGKEVRVRVTQITNTGIASPGTCRIHWKQVVS